MARGSDSARQLAVKGGGCASRQGDAGPARHVVAGGRRRHPARGGGAGGSPAGAGGAGRGEGSGGGGRRGRRNGGGGRGEGRRRAEEGREAGVGAASGPACDARAAGAGQGGPPQGSRICAVLQAAGSAWLGRPGESVGDPAKPREASQAVEPGQVRASCSIAVGRVHSSSA